MSTGQYLGSWWIVPASIAIMFGAGQVFSLDYYVIPWLKKKWKNVKLIRKAYLYHD
jgi:NADH dehydrogenase